MSLNFTNNTDVHIDSPLFQTLLDRAGNLEANLEGKEVELLLTNNDEIRELNKKYRNKDQATDVLSFAFEDAQSADSAQAPSEMLGQIAISVDRATQQAEEIGQSLEEELKFLFVHGLLHLLGYDHDSQENEKVMLEQAYEILGRK